MFDLEIRDILKVNKKQNCVTFFFRKTKKYKKKEYLKCYIIKKSERKELSFMRWITKICLLSFISSLLIPISTIPIPNTKIENINSENKIIDNKNEDEIEIIDNKDEYEIEIIDNKTIKPLLKNENINIKTVKQKISEESIKEMLLENIDWKDIYFKDENEREYRIGEIIQLEITNNEKFEINIKENSIVQNDDQNIVEEVDKKDLSNQESVKEEAVISVENVGEESIVDMVDSSVLDASASRDVPKIPDEKNILPLNQIFNVPVGKGPAIIQNGKVLQITSDIYQSGAIWSKQKINLDKDFRMRSWIYLGNQGKDAADGITFTLHNDSLGARAIGSSGSGLGAYSTRNSRKHISRALSFEFDTYYNNSRSPKDDMDYGLIRNNEEHKGHVAYTIPSGNSHIYQAGNHIEARFPTNFLSDGRWHQFDVNWDTTSKRLSILLPDLELKKRMNNNSLIPTDGTISFDLSDYKSRFGGSYVHWGFTGSTGALWAENAIAMTSIPNSVSHVATLKKEQENTYTNEIEANEKNIIDINDHLILDDKYSEFTKEAQIMIEMDNLEYQAGSLKIDNKKVTENNIKIEKNKLIVTLDEMASEMKKEADLNFKAKIKNSTPGTTKSYRFFYLDDGVISDSNEVKINFVKEKPQYFLSSQIKKVTDSDQMYRENISVFAGERVSIRNDIEKMTTGTKYEKYDSISTNLSGLDTDSLKVKINDEELKEKKFIRFEGDQLIISFFDDRWIETLNQKDRLEVVIEATVKQELEQDALSFDFRYSGPQYDNVSNVVTVDIKEEILNLIAVPSSIDFGKHMIDSKSHEFWATIVGDLIVRENRNKDANDWTLTINEVEPLTNQENEEKVLSDLMWWNDGPKKERITTSETVIKTYKHSGDYIVNTDWNEKNKRGISIEIPWNRQYVGQYQGKLEWRLKVTP